ncbi:MAG: hypothetical protein DRO15_02020 [Thermoprotei archaeon]|nr:MAG: hypothetical protein DRO15_02020 [Thermoprotei archaeon]
MPKLLKHLVLLWVFVFLLLSLLRRQIGLEAFYKGILALGFLGLLIMFVGFKYSTKYSIILIPPLILVLLSTIIGFPELFLPTVILIIATAILLWIWRGRVKEIFRAE